MKKIEKNGSSRDFNLLKVLLMLMFFVLAIFGFPEQAMAAENTLFFSEYIEGSGDNKALEIYNPTDRDINLSGYSIRMYFNGNATESTIINLTGTIQAKGVFVIVHNSANADIKAKADQLSTHNWYNGNDAVVLYHGSTAIDRIGKVGENPGTRWGSGSTSTVDNTLIRKSSIKTGDPNTGAVFDPSNEWIGLGKDVVIDLKRHELGTPLFFSEYIEGSSNNKALEIYNPTDKDITLNGKYIIKTYSNGSPIPSRTLDLVGTISAGGVFVIADAGASASGIISSQNQTAPTGWYNGDDALVLYYLDTPVDRIGKVGEDPGTHWGSDTTSTLDNTLIRKSTISSGDPDISANFDPFFEWIGLGQDVFSDTGSHEFKSPLFFSEYIEGDSNNKALEIYNPTARDIELNGNYSIKVYFNGATNATLTMDLNGTISAGGVFVIAHDEAWVGIKNKAQQTAGGGWYNGDDTVVLYYRNTPIDRIGKVGQQKEWGIGLTSTKDNTLTRKASVTTGDANINGAFDPSLEWIGYPRDYAKDLGTHELERPLFFSEYIEGSDNNKALEIYNPTDKDILLTGEYRLTTFFNDLTKTRTLNLIGTISAGGVFVIADAGAAPEIISSKNQIAPTDWFNGDDAIVLYHMDKAVDRIGKMGENIVWGTAPISTQDHTLIRKSTVTTGDPNFNQSFSPEDEWDGYPQNYFTDLGSHTFELPLFFTEYIEGSGNNKALEIYNPTDKDIILDKKYTIKMYFNGATGPGLTINLEGTIKAKDVFVVGHSGTTSSSIIAEKDQLVGDDWYNGDDAVVLYYLDNPIDRIGQVGFDPGTEWGSSPTSTLNHTLVRKGTVTKGDSNINGAFDPSIEWEGYPQNFFDDLGKYNEYTIVFHPGDHGAFATTTHVKLTYGAITPSAPTTDGAIGWEFIDWDPVLAATVTRSTTYTALWAEVPTGTLGNQSYYSIQQKDPEKALGGELKFSAARATAGTAITITTVPDIGFYSSKIIVTNRSGNIVEFVSQDNEKHVIKMPVGGAFVEVEFKKIRYFDDVNESDWFDDDAWYGAAHGLIVGVKDRIFGGKLPTNRAMLVTILHRLSGDQEVYENHFPDVGENMWYTNAISWAAKNEIVKGYGNGKYGPEDIITREQMALILMKYAEFIGRDTSKRGDVSAFEDSGDISDWAYEAVSWANGEGLIVGNGNKLMPKAGAERAHVAAILHRFIEGNSK